MNAGRAREGELLALLADLERAARLMESAVREDEYDAAVEKADRARRAVVEWHHGQVLRGAGKSLGEERGGFESWRTS